MTNYIFEKLSIVNSSGVWSDTKEFSTFQEAKQYIEDNIAGEYVWCEGQKGLKHKVWWAQQSEPFIAWIISRRK